MAPHNGILTPAQVATLRAVPTGHEPHAQGTAQDIAQALDITPAQAANALGALRRAGLVTRDAQGNGAGVATWARFDAIAPGLEAWQRLALEGAERAAPCRYQAEALESFGPECDAAPHGLAPRSDLRAETRDALKARDLSGVLDAIAPALDAGRTLRAANLYRAAASFCGGHARRARYTAQAERLEAQAKAEAQERGAFGMGTAIPPVDAPAPAQDLEAANCHCLECDSGFDMGPHDLQICPRCYPEGRAQAEARHAQAEAQDARTVANVLDALKAERLEAERLKAAQAAPVLALASPYTLEAFARVDSETGLALVYLPQNVATPWASYRVDLATGVCVAGDYLAPYDNARALALRAFSERLGDALGARAGAWA